MMKPGFAERFAKEWVAAWNAHDLDRVLSHYEDDFEMPSPIIPSCGHHTYASIAQVRLQWHSAPYFGFGANVAGIFQC
jgi:ketosteroid isomerase-like protein